MKHHKTTNLTKVEQQVTPVAQVRKINTPEAQKWAKEPTYSKLEDIDG